MKQKNTMTAKKEDNTIVASSSQQLECCMCGDSGLVHELFQCQVCQFRSQHRYCSNLYPKAESYKVCNWCLNQKEDSNSKDQKSQNSCNSSASCKGNSEGDSSKNNNIKKKRSDQNIVIKKSGSVSPGSSRGSQIHQQIRNHSNNLKLQVEIKKPKSPPQKSPSTPRKRIITNARLEEKLRRTKSEEISNSGLITRHVFRNKVRRYKLLDEVSS